MRRVKYRTVSAGPDGVRQPGQVAVVSDEEAAALEAGGFAGVLEGREEEPETATTEPPERAARRTRRARRPSP